MTRRKEEEEEGGFEGPAHSLGGSSLEKPVWNRKKTGGVGRVKGGDKAGPLVGRPGRRNGQRRWNPHPTRKLLSSPQGPLVQRCRVSVKLVRLSLRQRTDHVVYLTAAHTADSVLDDVIFLPSRLSLARCVCRQP